MNLEELYLNGLLPENPNDIYHHGILGMKWGVHRYQPYPKGYKGSGKEVGEAKRSRKERREEKRKANKYNYKEDNSYKKLTSSQKYYQDRIYKENLRRFGKRAANRIEYSAKVLGKRRTEQTEIERKNHNRIVTASLAVGLATYYFGPVGEIAIKDLKNKAALGSSLADAYGKTEGLKTYVGGFTTGFEAVKNGKKYLKRMGF